MAQCIKVTENTNGSKYSAHNAGRFSFLQEKPALLLYNKINAIIAATRFLKKLFSIDGRSPDSFTHKFIIEKPNAEIKIHTMALFFVFI